MANRCEPVQGSSYANKPKGLIGLDQKVRWQEPRANDRGSRLQTTRSTCGCLRSHTPKAELGNPVSPPGNSENPIFPPLPQVPCGRARIVPIHLNRLSRQADRKESPRRCRTGCWKKRMPSCSGPDTGSEFARRESELTSSRCLSALNYVGPSSRGNGERKHRFRPVACAPPTTPRIRSHNGGGPFVPWLTAVWESRRVCPEIPIRHAGRPLSAFEMLERSAVKVACCVLRGVGSR